MRLESKPRHKVHGFICNAGRACKARKSQQLLEEVKLALKEKYPRTDLRINQSGCLGACEEGISAVLYLAGNAEPIWIHELKSQDAARFIQIIEQQLKKLNFKCS